HRSAKLTYCRIWPDPVSTRTQGEPDARRLPANTREGTNYSQMLVNTNAMLQMSISQTIASQAATSARAGAAGAGANAARPPQCDLLPPPDLQRGADGHVPPELQGDPRYQAWLRCRQGQAAGAPPGWSSSSAGGSPPGGWLNSPSHAGTPVATTGGHYPTPALQHHLPLGATDFK